MTTKGRWTKKIDEMHVFEVGKTATVCGRPMLGNNYAGHFQPKDGMWKMDEYPEYDRPMCETCAEAF